MLRRAALVALANLMNLHGPAAAAFAQAQQASPFTLRPRLLVIDDDPDMVLLLAGELGPEFILISAQDGISGLQQAIANPPDIILLDNVMPGKTGIEVCRGLRAHPVTAQIPVILLTGRVAEEIKVKALSAGASDFIAKPFSPVELKLRVNHLLTVAQQHRLLSERNLALQMALMQLKQAEAQLVQSEKMASLGRMSAGLIHEINNPLNFAKTGLFLLRQLAGRLPEEDQPDFKDILGDVEDGLCRVQETVSELRGFCHPHRPGKDWVPWERVAGTALRLLSHEWRDRVAIEKQIDDRRGFVGSHSQMVQVLMNLLHNSFDALRGKRFERDEPLVTIRAGSASGFSWIKIRDNGSGIEEDHLNKIFDPFFTTKEPGAGMGLGLSICYRVVQDHGGAIRVSTRLGEYSEFTVELPDAEPSDGGNQHAKRE